MYETYFENFIMLD